jgi:carboxyl-terminal processing protease
MSPSFSTELKQDKFDGVLIDLRNNGGGSLAEAIDLTGLFVGKGPVVQQRGADGKVEVETDDLPGTCMDRSGWGADQSRFRFGFRDFCSSDTGLRPRCDCRRTQLWQGYRANRGQSRSGGHNSKPKFGELKMTVAQFFRVNGGTTQLRGVTPDISLPGLSDPKPSVKRVMTMLCRGHRSSLRNIRLPIPRRLCFRNCKARHDARVQKRSGFPALFGRYGRTESAARQRRHLPQSHRTSE